MKKVLLIIVDALSTNVVKAALSNAKLPNIQSLIDAGEMNEQCTSIFPSLTLAATPSITTGTYPNAHGMMGAYWYEQTENRVVYFGADVAMVFRQGPGRFLTDFLVDLNDRWLNAPTIFEYLDDAGRTTASINWFIYKGRTEHQIEMPILHLVPNAPAAQTIRGPSTLHLGDFTNHSERLSDDEFGADGGMFNRFGFTDEITQEVLMQLVEKKALPDFTLAYFPDNDFNSHEVGPFAAVTTVEQFDRYLGELFTVSGGVEKLLDDITLIITGDHSQSDIVDDANQAAIDLTQVIPDFPAAEVGKGFDEDVDIVLCPNGRVASIYLRDASHENINTIIKRLLADERVDQVLAHNDYLHTHEGSYHIFTHERGELHFGQTEFKNGRMLRDRYGEKWYWQGSLDVFGEQYHEKGNTFFPTYPNALERIANLLHSDRSGHIWVTAKIGCDFVIPGIEAHVGGGSHGSLHVLDSTAPIIAAGLPKAVSLPSHPRLIDIMPLCLQVLDVDVPDNVGNNIQ